MKKLLIMAAAALCAACSGTGKQGENGGADSLQTVPDSVIGEKPATGPVEDASQAADADARFADMQTASFLNLFKAEIGEDGTAVCEFQNTKSDSFEMVFGEPKKNLGRFKVQNQKGKVVALYCEVIGGGVDPYLFMIMDDGFVESVSLYNLSQGQFKTEYRSDSGDIVSFKTYEGDMGIYPVGITSKGEEVTL